MRTRLSSPSARSVCFRSGARLRASLRIVALALVAFGAACAQEPEPPKPQPATYDLSELPDSAVVYRQTLHECQEESHKSLFRRQLTHCQQWLLPVIHFFTE